MGEAPAHCDPGPAADHDGVSVQINNPATRVLKRITVSVYPVPGYAHELAETRCQGSCSGSTLTLLHLLIRRRPQLGGPMG